MSDEMTFILNSPLTEEEWDMITDVDFDHTSEITFHTKHGKEVVFVKRKTGHWIDNGYDTDGTHYIRCSLCECDTEGYAYDYCPNCGARMDP